MRRSPASEPVVDVRDAARWLIAALVVVAFFFLGTVAFAQPLTRCHPNTWMTPWGTGSDYHHAKTDKASGRFIWCKQPAGGWNIIAWQFRLNDVNAPAGWQFDAAEARVKKAIQLAAAGTVTAAEAASAAIDAELKAAHQPLDTPAKRYEFLRLKYTACKEMIAQPMPVVPPGGITPPAANWCEGWNPGSTPPVDPVLYVVTSATSAVRPAYPVVSGKRSTQASGTAVPGQPCDCTALQIIEFNVARYCASPSITGITGPAVTACQTKR